MREVQNMSARSLHRLDCLFESAANYLVEHAMLVAQRIPPHRRGYGVETKSPNCGSNGGNFFGNLLRPRVEFTPVKCPVFGRIDNKPAYAKLVLTRFTTGRTMGCVRRVRYHKTCLFRKRRERKNTRQSQPTIGVYV